METFIYRIKERLASLPCMVLKATRIAVNGPSWLLSFAVRVTLV